MLQNLKYKNVWYMLYTPPKPTTNLLVFFHGAGEGGYSDGSQINRLLKNGYLKLVNEGRDFPFMILAPQGNDDPGMAGPSFSRIHAVLPEIIATLKPTKVVFTGLSLGGQETIGYYTNAKYMDNGLPTYPFLGYDKVDGFVAVCGKPPGTSDWNAVDKPMLLVHGDSDDRVNISNSQKVVRYVSYTNKANKATLLTIPGGEHNTAWEYAYNPLNDPYGIAVMNFLKAIFKDEELPAPVETYPKEVIGIRILNASTVEFSAEDGSKYTSTVTLASK